MNRKTIYMYNVILYNWHPIQNFVLIYLTEADEEVPFDKQDIITKIQAGGGVVLDKFDEAAVCTSIVVKFQLV